VKQYFKNIYLFLIIEKYNMMNSLIDKYYFIACNIDNNNIFINKNQLLNNDKDIICNEFIEFINKPINKNNISYSRFNCFYYLGEDNNIIIPKISYNIFKDTQYIYCVHNYFKKHFGNTIKYLENDNKL
jgi:hypothetical protein